jgi:hypothetical protein
MMVNMAGLYAKSVHRQTCGEIIGFGLAEWLCKASIGLAVSSIHRDIRQGWFPQDWATAVERFATGQA